VIGHSMTQQVAEDIIADGNGRRDMEIAIGESAIILDYVLDLTMSPLLDRLESMSVFKSKSRIVMAIGHEGSVGLSVYKVHISATRWRFFTLTAVALRFCRDTEKTPSSGGYKRRATAKSLND
jgi:hypothetical protein